MYLSHAFNLLKIWVLKIMDGEVTAYGHFKIVQLIFLLVYFKKLWSNILKTDAY